MASQRTSPSLIDILLDPSRVLLERRIITLPLAGDVVLSIVRTGPGAARSMDLLEHAVRSVEEYMDAPFPTSYVGLLYENAVFGSNAGTNFGTHIAILPEYDVDDGSHEAEFAGSAIAHEVTHYYWSGNADWVDEGAADLMASIVEGARTGRPVGVTNPPCAYARTIAELESLGISRVDVEFGFNYSLGERLFVDLRRTLGDERFRQGFRALYLASELEDAADDRRGTSVGIEHIREAFRSDDRGGERRHRPLVRRNATLRPLPSRPRPGRPRPARHRRARRRRLHHNEPGRTSGIRLFRAGCRRLGIRHVGVLIRPVGRHA